MSASDLRGPDSGFLANSLRRPTQLSDLESNDYRIVEPIMRIKYHWLLIAIAVGVAGILVGRALKLSQISALTLALVPANLASFPFMKHWMPKATFLYWVTVNAISTLMLWVLYFVFGPF